MNAIIIMDASAKEIAALVLAVQERQFLSGRPSESLSPQPPPFQPPRGAAFFMPRPAARR